MRLLMTLLLALAALSGCLGDDDPTPADQPDAAADDAAMADEPQITTYSCTVDVGIPVVSLSGPANIGGCALAEIASDFTVVESTPAASCTIQYDMDADNLSDGEVVVGATYGAGTSFTAFCDPPAVGAENSLALTKA